WVRAFSVWEINNLCRHGLSATFRSLPLESGSPQHPCPLAAAHLRAQGEASTLNLAFDRGNRDDAPHVERQREQKLAPDSRGPSENAEAPVFPAPQLPCPGKEIAR